MNPISIYRIIMTATGDYAGSLKRSLGFTLLAAIAQGVGFALYIPTFLAFGHDNIRQGIIWLSVITAVLLSAMLFRWCAQNYDFGGDCARAGDAMRRKLGNKLRRIPLETLYQRRSGELNALLAGTVDEVFNYTLNVSTMLINAILIPLATALVSLFFDWHIGLVMLTSYPLILPICYWAQPLLNRNNNKISTANSKLNAELLEYTQGLPVLKAANCTGAHLSRLQHAISDVENIQAQNLRSEAIPNALLGSVIEICALLILLAGMLWVVNGSLSAWLLCGLMVASVRFAEPLGYFLSMTNVYIMVQNGYIRLNQLMHTPLLPQQNEVTTPTHYDIALHDVHFHYATKAENILQGTNLHVPERALTALVGSSGCGKTTVTRLIMRYADLQQGKITIGGIDIRAFAPETLMQLISVVFQDVYLFDDTIMNNIRLGKADASNTEVEAAARTARCHDFIMALPEGYQTRVGDVGGKLSGGEKQRISIARALLKNAPIIILDEPTASLDSESEVAVQEAIDALVRDKTVIVITHRLSTISGAHQIIVLENGIVAESGTHDALLTRQGRYASLWQASTV